MFKKTELSQFIVKPGSKVNLSKFDTACKPEGLKKKKAKKALAESIERLSSLQDKLYAQGGNSVLIVIQAMDAAGKDGTIKHVMSGVNPQGCQVHSFKVPSSEELDHDFLWRCNKRLPLRGHIGIFNRSYYEEVLIAKVHEEVLDKQHLPERCKGKNIWQGRYESIKDFERHLAQNGTVVIKIFLHLSKGEQLKRFLDRIDRPEKNWKFSESDAQERLYWDQYQKAYAECLEKTSTKAAPWHVVPADNKDTARLIVSEIIIAELTKLKLAYPEVNDIQHQKLARAKALLLAEKDKS